jgi:hypothetical protein
MLLFRVGLERAGIRLVKCQREHGNVRPAVLTDQIVQDAYLPAAGLVPRGEKTNNQRPVLEIGEFDGRTMRFLKDKRRRGLGLSDGILSKRASEYENDRKQSD